MIQIPDVQAGVKAAVDNAQQSIKAVWRRLVRTVVRFSIKFCWRPRAKIRLVIFKAADVAAPLSTILESDL